MGREAKILLAFLGLLAGVFCGVLSMKLLVPRPPAGAGPDIHASGMFLGFTEIVDPPLLPLRATDFAAAPPLVHGGPPGSRPPEPHGDPITLAAAATPLPAAASTSTGAEAGGEAADDDLLPPPAEFVLAPPARPIDEASAPPAERRDPFIARTAWNPADAPADDSPGFPPDVPPDGFARPQTLPSSLPPVAAATLPPAAAAGVHVVRAGDSWWSLAESAYGDGRFFRALFAWNRAVDPRVSLATGTQLELPPPERLRAAWPKLVPPAER